MRRAYVQSPLAAVNGLTRPLQSRVIHAYFIDLRRDTSREHSIARGVGFCRADADGRGNCGPRHSDRIDVASGGRGP